MDSFLRISLTTGTLVTLLTLSGCATTLQTGSHCSADEQLLASNQTYSWRTDGAIDLIDESGYISPTIVAQLKTRVERELTAKGYTLIEASTTGALAELEVQLYLRARREVQQTGAYGSGTDPCAYPDCWQAPHDSSVSIYMQTVGFLAADVYQAGEPVWRGWVERLLYPSERDAALIVIDQAVPKLFESFPVSTNLKGPKL